MDLYDIGDELTLMSIVKKNENGFTYVAHSEGVDQPEVIYSYSSHVRMLNANLPYLIDCF